MRNLIFLFGLALLVACTEKEPGYHVDEYQEVKIEDLASEIKIPTKAWDLLEGKTPASGEHHEEPAAEEHGGGAAASSLSKDFVFSEVSVFLVEKNNGVLKKPAYKISFPRGGGEIDLANYAGISNGTFYVGFDFPEFTEAENKKVLFVSQAKKRKIDEEVYGMGCNQFVDMTDQFMALMPKAGIKVNTTRDRHSTVLGGHFLFSAQKGNTVFTSQVTFKDSRNMHLYCEAR